MITKKIVDKVTTDFNKWSDDAIAILADAIRLSEENNHKYTSTFHVRCAIRAYIMSKFYLLKLNLISHKNLGFDIDNATAFLKKCAISEENRVFANSILKEDNFDKPLITQNFHQILSFSADKKQVSLDTLIKEITYVSKKER